MASRSRGLATFIIILFNFFSGFSGSDSQPFTSELTRDQAGRQSGSAAEPQYFEYHHTISDSVTISNAPNGMGPLERGLAVTPSSSPFPSSSRTSSKSPPASQSSSITLSSSRSYSRSLSPSRTPTISTSPSRTRSSTAKPSVTATDTRSPSKSLSNSITPTRTCSITAGPSGTASPSKTSSKSLSPSRTSTDTPSSSKSMSKSRSSSASIAPSSSDTSSDSFSATDSGSDSPRASRSPTPNMQQSSRALNNSTVDNGTTITGSSGASYSSANGLSTNSILAITLPICGSTVVIVCIIAAVISARRKRALTKRSAVNSIANVPSSSVIPRPGADPIPLFIGTEEPVNHKSSAVVVVVADKSGVKVTKRRNARTVSTVTGSSSVSQQSHDRHGRVLPLRRGKRWRRRSSRRHAHQPIHSSHSAGGSTTVYSNNDEDDDVISPYSDSRGHSRRQYSSRSADPRAVFIDSDVHDPDWSDDDVHTEYSYDSDEDSRWARRQSSRHTGNRSTQVLVRSVVRAPPRPSKLQLAVARYHRANQIQRSAGSELESDAQAREPRVRTVKSFARRMLSAGSRAGSGSFTGHTGDREQLLAIAEEDVYTRKAAKLDAQLVQSSTEAGDHTLLRLKVFDAVAKVIEDDISTAKAEIRKYKSRVARPA